MLRVGLIGCGTIGRAHSLSLWALRKAGLTDAAVVAVADPDADRAGSIAQPNGAEVMGIAEVLGSVDVVYVGTPTATHEAIVEAAAARGLAIYCEKPLGPDLDSARRVAALLKTVPHQVGLALRSAPVFAAMEQAIRSGRYGRLMTVILRDDQYFPIQGAYASSWRSDVALSGGGTLIEHSIHDLDLFRWLCGDPERVACRTSSFFGYPGIEDFAATTLSFADGATGALTSIWHQVLSRGSTRRVEVFCEEAFLWTEDDNTGPLHVQTSAGTEVIACDPPSWVDEIPVPEAGRRTLGLYAEASRRFLASIEAGSAGSPGEGEALAAHVLVDAAYRSAASGGRPVQP
ncbi:MAG TPA: Gfo/Idh/MocA family oxidoreductase [Actinomycetota bacterium]|jgi:myo-inositol 2-dehydrogenase/D-chiro-inositol 1-dehydrogenase|nr:Gfo/Idh/MocA family oxidoreductase [Actinomycetota bacterium]